jgi:general secretion pathway protein D
LILRNNSTALRHCIAMLSLCLGVLVAPASIAGDEITLNFKDADIGTVIETVSQVTNRNFIIDPRVKGKVTVISAQPMDAKLLYQTFLSILEVHGFATVESGDITKILPQTNAKQQGGQKVNSRAHGGDELVTRVLPIEHVTAAQLVPILRPLLPQYGHLAAYAPTNILIISDRAANVDRLMGIVQKIDIPTDAEIELVTLEHANASEVVRILSSLKRATPGNNSSNEAPTFIADTRTNSILLGGDKTTRLELRAIINHLDTPLDNDGTTQVIYLKYAKSKEMSTILQGYADATATSSGGKDGGKTTKEVTILADENTNSLVITAPPRPMRELLSVIKQLDIRRAQVLVEAIIAEVTVDDASALGFNWAGATSAGIILSETPSPIGVGIGSVLGALTADNPAAALGTAASFPGITLGGGITSNGQLKFLGLLRALSSNTNNNVLSTPSLLAMDNQEAEISIGQEVPFLTGQFTSTGSGSSSSVTNPFQTIERKDVGITMRITPHVVDQDTVELKLYQEVSNLVLSAGSLQTADVVTNKRTIDTTVIVDNGEIVALGGLIDDTVAAEEQRVPILGDIPILGNLFKGRRSQRTKRNLMIFIRPVVLNDGADLYRYSKERYNLLRGLQQQRWGGEDGSALPALPAEPAAEATPEQLSLLNSALVQQTLSEVEAKTKPEEEQDDAKHRRSRFGPRGR